MDIKTTIAEALFQFDSGEAMSPEAAARLREFAKSMPLVVEQEGVMYELVGYRSMIPGDLFHDGFTVRKSTQTTMAPWAIYRPLPPVLEDGDLVVGIQGCQELRAVINGRANIVRMIKDLPGHGLQLKDCRLATDEEIAAYIGLRGLGYVSQFKAIIKEERKLRK